MEWLDIVGSEAGLTLAAALAGAAWTWFRGQEAYRRARTSRFERALLALEAGVEKSYRSYVRAVKRARADGRLTPTEQRNARRIARETATAYGRKEGVDVLREIGEDYLDLWIAKLVKQLKA